MIIRKRRFKIFVLNKWKEGVVINSDWGGCERLVGNRGVEGRGKLGV